MVERLAQFAPAAAEEDEEGAEPTADPFGEWERQALPGFREKYGGGGGDDDGEEKAAAKKGGKKKK